MSVKSAYALRQRPDAQAFRLAWRAAKEVMVDRLDDAAMARAINGVPIPIFHNGEQIGERRHFDERLTMFLLRYRDPVRYGRWVDRSEPRQHEDGPIAIFSYLPSAVVEMYLPYSSGLSSTLMPILPRLSAASS